VDEAATTEKGALTQMQPMTEREAMERIRKLANRLSEQDLTQLQQAPQGSSPDLSKEIPRNQDNPTFSGPILQQHRK